MPKIYSTQQGDEEGWEIMMPGPFTRVERKSPLTIHYPTQAGIPGFGDDPIPIRQFAVTLAFPGYDGGVSYFDINQMDWIILTVAGNGASSSTQVGEVIRPPGLNALIVAPIFFETTLDTLLPGGSYWTILRRILHGKSVDYQQ